MREITRKGFDIMDETERLLLDGRFEEGISHVVNGFKQLRRNSSAPDWTGFVEAEFLDHPVTSIIHQCPFTHHSFTKPRKYAGDAELVDYMYHLRSPGADVTEIGREVFKVTTNAPAPQSVRARREIIARMIDELTEDSDKMRILSVACGHVREAMISEAVVNGRVSEYFALDQDALSLEVVRNELSQFNVKPIHASIKSLFTNGHEFQNLDLVYAAGLYDYLSQPVAAKLTAKLFGMLRSGGKLLVANFAPSLRDIGYMESFMQWKLIYREEAEVADFARLIDPEKIAARRLFWDEPGNVIYLELLKK